MTDQLEEGLTETTAIPTMSTDNHRIVSLHAGYEANGAYVNAYVARPVDGGQWPGVVLLADMNGLTWTQREITRIYARAGFVAVSPDYMEGLLPPDPVEVLALSRADRLHAKNSLDVNRGIEQIAAAADFLRSLPWVGPQGKVAIQGPCLGGGLALLAAAKTQKFQAGIIYHQSLFPDARELQGITCRLQCHYGTDDRSTTRGEVDAFTRALDGYGVEYEVFWYEGMGHSFAQITPDAEVPPERRAAAELSQQRCFEFLRKELGIDQNRTSNQKPTPRDEAPARVQKHPEAVPVTAPPNAKSE